MSKGFTLLELLLAIAVLAILSAIIVPAVGAAIDSSRSARCLMNLRQLGAATSMYLADNEQRFPPINTWARDLGSYLDVEWSTGGVWRNPLADRSSPFMCPQSLDDKKNLSPGYNYQLSYGINCNSVAGKTVDSLSEVNGRTASNTLLYADCTLVNLWDNQPARVPVGWHRRGVNTVFCDYRVENTGISNASGSDWVALLKGLRR